MQRHGRRVLCRVVRCGICGLLALPALHSEREREMSAPSQMLMLPQTKWTVPEFVRQMRLHHASLVGVNVFLVKHCQPRARERDHSFPVLGRGRDLVVTQIQVLQSRERAQHLEEVLQ